jgi:RNA polymerase sigma-70 factor (ECF subfamily)
MEQISDVGRLARAARQGDAAAVDAFVRAVQPSVVRAVRLVVGAGSSVAEEACQEALVDIVGGISGLSSPESAEAWVMRIAMRRAIRAARRQSIRARFAGQGDGEVALALETRTSERMLEIHEAFGALPVRLRAVAVMRLYLDLSEEQTAIALECSPGTVKSRLHAARRRLQRSLGDADSAPISQVETARKPA